MDEKNRATSPKPSVKDTLQAQHGEQGSLLDRPFNVWRSRKLDVHRWSEHPNINGLVETVYANLPAEFLAAAITTSNNKGKSKHWKQLKVLLLDLYVAWKADPLLCIGVAMGTGDYVAGSRYNALHISSRIREIIYALQDVGYIGLSKGSYHLFSHGMGNRTTRIWPAPRLIDEFQKVGLETYQISLHHDQECIILTKSDTDEVGDSISSKGKKGSPKPTDYQDTDNTRRMRKELQAYNALLERTYIDIPSLKETVIIRKSEDGKEIPLTIDQSHKFVRRIFSRENWEMNGRFYGGWWQQIEEELRASIAINGLPIVEVDYRGLHPSILSAQKGILLKGDRYELGKILIDGATKDQQREWVKLLVLTALNAKTKKAAFSAFRKKCDPKSRGKRLKNNELEKLLDGFANKHPHLAADLCSDRGIHLMFLDSQIAAYIINKFTTIDVPILCIHDSFIVDTLHAHELQEAMSEASQMIVGFDLEAERTQMAYSDFAKMPIAERSARHEELKSTMTLKDKTNEYNTRYKKWLLLRSNH